MSVSAGAIRAGRAFYELLADDTQLQKTLARVQRNFRSHALALEQQGRRAMMTATVLGAPLVAAGRQWAAFELQMAEVATMLRKPEQYMGEYSDAVRRMAVEFGESTANLSRGLYEILSASVDPAHALEVLAVAVRAAKGGLTDTGTAADALTTILNAYSLSADQAGLVSDKLFMTVKHGKLHFEDIAGSIGMVATTAASAGVSLDELLSMVGVLTQAGIKTENAITSINSVILGFLKPSDKAAESARQMGFELNTATLRAEGLIGIFRRLKSASPERVAATFPNIRAIRGLFPALERLGKYDEIFRDMQSSAGEADVAFLKVSKSLGFALAQAVEMFKSIGLAIGEALAGSMRSAIGGFRVFTTWLTTWIREHRTIISLLASSVVGLFAFGAAMVATGSVIRAVMTIFDAAVKTIAALKLVCAALSAAMRGVAMAGILAWINPLTALAAVVGVVAVSMVDWGAVLRRITGQTQQATGATRDLEESLRGVVEAARNDSAEAERKIRRLAELRQNQRRTNEESIEMISLADELADKYPDLAFALDKVGASARDTAAAIRLVNEQLREGMATGFEEKIEESSKKLQQLKADRAKLDAYTEEGLKRAEAAKPSVEHDEAGIGYVLHVLYLDRYRKQLAEKKRLDGEIATLEATIVRKRNTLAQYRNVGKDETPLHEKLFPKEGAGDYYNAVMSAQQAALNAWREKNLDLIEEVERARIDAIADEQRRELAMLDLVYRRRLAKAREENKDVRLVNQAHAIEAETIRRKHADRRAEEEKRDRQKRRQEDERRADREGDLRYEIAKSEVELAMPEGLERQRKLLELDRKRELAAARREGIDQALVNRKYDMLVRIAELEETKRLTQERFAGQSSRGIFDVGKLLSLQGGSGHLPRIAAATEATKRNTQEIARQNRRRQQHVFN